MNATELKGVVDVVAERLDNAINNLKRLEEEGKEASQALGGLRTLQDVVQDLKKWKEEEDKEREAYLHLKRDVDELKKWRTDQKLEKDEASRRWWAFGPNITAALIGGFITLVGVAVNLAVTLSLRKP